MKPRIIVHGGVDTEANENVHALLSDAAGAGFRRLLDGGGSVAAVVAAVAVLEDCTELNAGQGAVLDETGKVRLDAGLVDGRTQRFAALTGVEGVRNPIAAAGRLLRGSDGPVLLAGEGATEFALADGPPATDLRTAEQIAIWEAARSGDLGNVRSAFTGRAVSLSETVGCIAVDDSGNVAVGSSTGGVLLKKAGRVGDAAICGAGLYADEQVAVMCSGQGEIAIELSLALRAALHASGTPHLSGQTRRAQDAATWAVEYGVKRRGMAGGVVVYDAAFDRVGVASSTRQFAVLTHDDSGSQFVGNEFVEGAGR